MGSSQEFLHLNSVKSTAVSADNNSATRSSDTFVLASEMQLMRNMELLGRVCAALGISLVLTLLLIVLYQDDAPQAQSLSMTQATAITQTTP